MRTELQGQLIELRKRAGLSRLEAGRRLEITATDLWRYERGEVVPGLFRAWDMGQVYGVDMETVTRAVLLDRKARRQG